MYILNVHFKNTFEIHILKCIFEYSATKYNFFNTFNKFNIIITRLFVESINF